MPPRSWQEGLKQTAFEFVLGVVWPRTLRRRTARRELAFAAYKTVAMTVMRQWLGPWLHANHQRHEAVKTRLRRELGREPTPIEVSEAVMREGDADSA